MSVHVVACAECGEPTDPWARSTAHEIVGWELPREGGGLHHVLFKERSGRVMCMRCRLRKQATGNAAQGSLL